MVFKRVGVRLGLVGIVVALLAGMSLGQYSGGAGTEGDPYQIATAGDLIALGGNTGDYDKCFVLTADIDLAGYEFDHAVIAWDEDTRTFGFQGNSFSGVFNGNGHTINNFSINQSSKDFIGIFGTISNGKIENVGVKNSTLAGRYYVGGLCGYSEASIELCKVQSTDITGYSGTGGLVGNNNGTINWCQFDGTVSGNWTVGGLAGYTGGTIFRSFATGTIIGSSENIGGLCGGNSGSINQCFFIGHVSGKEDVGGFCGGNGGLVNQCYAKGEVNGSDNYTGGLCGTNRGIITQCYSTAKTKQGDVIGGLCGTDEGIGAIYDSYWDMETSEMTCSAGGWGLTQEQVTRSNSYTGWTDGNWIIDEGVSPPRLLWEETGGNAINAPYPERTYEGSGTSEDPYIINTADDLMNLRQHSMDWDKYFELNQDIDMDHIILNSSLIAFGSGFNGVFDGKGHVIRNMEIQAIHQSYNGLFYRIDSEAEVKNMGIENIKVVGDFYVGSFCGRVRGSISRCYAKNVYVQGTTYIGGFVGNCLGGVIDQCYSFSTIAHNDTWGSSGVFGGHIYSGSVLSQCYASGVMDRFSAGEFYAYTYGATIRQCFWEIYSTGQPMVTGSTSTPSPSHGQMFTVEPYQAAGWDFSDEDGDIADWSMYPNSYPALSWESADLVFIPDVNGMDLASAQAAIANAGLSVYIIAEYSKTVSEGELIRQETLSGQMANRGQPVILVISRGIKYSGGNGTPDDPFEIGNADDLVELSLAGDLDKHYVLVADIDLAGAGTGEGGVFTQALLGTSTSSPFNGVLDGDGHIIYNLMISKTDSDYMGLCGVLGPESQIRNLGLEKVDIQGRGYVGGVCGRCYGEISNCYVRGKVNGYDNYGYVGGLCGSLTNGTISRSYADVDVRNDSGCGGFCGSNSNGIISECYSKGYVNNAYAGGFCYYNYGTINNCFWDIETSGRSSSSGGTGLATSAMLNLQTYLDAGWDFSEDDGDGANWVLYEGYYPTLAWQTEIMMPNIIGYERNEAYLILSDLGLQVVSDEEFSSEVAMGHVIRQYPVSGQTLAVGLTARLVVSRGLPCLGNGTELDPYQINTAGQWRWLSETPEVWDKHFILMADLDFEGIEIKPIGAFSDSNNVTNDIPFTGFFEGNGHSIKNLKMTFPASSFPQRSMGLFAFVDGAVIQNLGLVDFVITVDENINYNVSVGGIAGKVSSESPYTNGCHINNCYVTGIIRHYSPYGQFGGIVGYNYCGRISQCYADCKIEDIDNAPAYTGALMGLSIGKGNGISQSFWNVEKDARGVGRMLSPSVYDILGLPLEAMQTSGFYLESGWDFIGETQNGMDDIWHMPWGQAGLPMLWNQKDIPGDVAGGYGVDLADFDRLSIDWLNDDGNYQFDGVSGPDGCVDAAELGMIADNWLAQPELGEKVSLVTHWPFDVDGMDIEQGIEAEMKNGAMLVQEPGDFRIGMGAVKFDGVDDLLECESEHTLPDRRLFSLAMWIKVDQILFNRTMHIIGQRDGTDHLWSLQLWGANEAHLTGYVSGASSYALTETSFTPIRDCWYHVAMTYNDYDDRKVHLYINGEEVTTVQQVAMEDELYPNTTIPVSVGDRIGGGRAFSGNVDDLRLYHRILTIDEIYEIAELDQPFSYWPFDTNSDDLRNMNNAVLENGACISQIPGDYRAGQGAMRMDGEDDIAICRGNVIPNDASAISVALWFKADEVPAYKTVHLIGQRTLSEHIWSLQIWGTNGRHLTGFIEGNGGNAITETSFVPEAGRWYHVAMTYDDAGDKIIHIHVDGIEVGIVEQTSLSGAPMIRNSDVKLSIGDRIGGSRAFKGSIDEVQIYPRELTKDEILTMADREKMVAYWPLDYSGNDIVGGHFASLLNGANYTQEAGMYRFGTGAMKLDGVDDVARCDLTAVSGYDAFSVAMWIRADAISSTQTMQLIGQRNTNEHQWSFQLWGTNNGHLTGFVGGNVTDALTETMFAPEVGRWYHVVMMYDDQGDRKVHIYVDGIEVDVMQQTAMSGGRLTGTVNIPVTLGDKSGGGRAFGGKIDEVMIYRRVLTDEEIMELALGEY